MNGENLDWRSKLRDWLARNPKTAPEASRRLREQFVQQFPKEGLAQLTLEQYALGRDDAGKSFCYWLEYETTDLGSILGGNVSKFWVWWDKKKKAWQWIKGIGVQSAADALSLIKQGLTKLVQTVEEARFDQLDEIGDEYLRLASSLRAKPLFLYFPDEFLPISNKDHLTHFLKLLGQSPEGGLHAQNRQLLEYLRAQPEFAGVDTLQMMRFLYESHPPPARLRQQAPGETASTGYEDTPPGAVETPLPASRVDLGHSLNWIFYGPPGTGKTWSALHEVRQLLLSKNLGQAESARYAKALTQKNSDELNSMAALLEGTGEQQEIRYWWVT